MVFLLPRSVWFKLSPTRRIGHCARQTFTSKTDMRIDWHLKPATLGGLLLVLLYTVFYLRDPAAPGAQLDPCCVTGWIGWGDQGFYYRSARALAAGNFDPGQHWYPLGYALLGAPFVFLRNHAFFFVDLASLLGAYAAFIVFAGRIRVSAFAAVLIFLLTSCADPVLFRQWVIPWNTTPTAAAIWALLAVSAAYLQGERHPFLLGILAAAVPIIRPTDGIISVICLGWVGIETLRRRQSAIRDGAAMAAGILLLILPYAALHLRIYGPNATTYMINSRYLGFTLHNPLFRAYILLIEPRQWYFAGQGLMRHMPWLLFGFAGMAVAWRRGSALALLSVCLAAYFALYLSYVDLLPTGLWRYLNVHYFKWTWAGFGLVGWLLVRDLFARRREAWVALAAVFLLSCIRVVPRLADPAEPAVAVDLRGAAATEANTTMDPTLAVQDSAGLLRSIATMRAFPLPEGAGVRLIAVRRDFVGTVTWAPGHELPMLDDQPPQSHWAEQIGFGFPCWLAPRFCKTPALLR